MVEVKDNETETDEKTEKVVKTEQERADDMYPDQAEKKESTDEKETDDEAEDGKKKEEQSSDKDGEEDKGEQEETKDREEKELTLTLSKDSPLNDDALTNLTEFAKENKLDQDQAQKILEREEAAATSFVETQKADHETLVAEWGDEIKNDPVLGGENLGKSMQIAKRPLLKYGGEEISDWLKQTGFDNNPVVFRYHHKLGLAMGDDKFVEGTPPEEKKKSRAHRMYPDNVPGSSA